MVEEATSATPEQPSAQPKKTKKKNKHKQAITRARHRLWSIFRDVRGMLELHQRALDETNDSLDPLVRHALQHWHTVANERCGSWYVNPHAAAAAPSSSSPSCYFKSTDGHVNTWNLSLKRLNLALMDCVASTGGCLVVDASVRRLLPDALSKTIPIWASVMNKVVKRYREELGMETEGASNSDNIDWNTRIHTPHGVVSRQEHDQISGLLDDRAESLFRSGAIVDPHGLVRRLTRPLRVLWMNHEGTLYESNGDTEEESAKAEGLEKLVADYFVILCWNPSRYRLKEGASQDDLLVVDKHYAEWVSVGGEENAIDGSENTNNTNNHHRYLYTPGAADDHESWARHLTPRLFWEHQKRLLDPKRDDAKVDELIDELVQQHSGESSEHDPDQATATLSHSDRLGTTNLWVGSRTAGRPPACWESFDAVLNATTDEYEGMAEECDATARFYLQLPVAEGKRDKTQLEHWMPVGATFVIHHLQHERRVLIHCAQGRDRSVAVALVALLAACPLHYPLRYRPEFRDRVWNMAELAEGTDSNHGDETHLPDTQETTHSNETECYQSSGLPSAVVSNLLGQGGKEAWLSWVHARLGHSSPQLRPLATKEGVRIALQLLRQDWEVASPTRSTLQKIHRFLMSAPSLYR